MKQFNHGPKFQAMYDVMAPETKSKLESLMQTLEEKAKTDPAIAKMLAPPKPVDFSDIPIDVDWTFEELTENFRSIEHLPRDRS